MYMAAQILIVRRAAEKNLSCPADLSHVPPYRATKTHRELTGEEDEEKDEDRPHREEGTSSSS